MIGKTNVGGMSMQQAMIKGTDDATISPETILKGQIGYGKYGKRMVGTYDGRKVAEWVYEQGIQINTFNNKLHECGFRPSIVLMYTLEADEEDEKVLYGLIDSRLPSLRPTSKMYEFGTKLDIGQTKDYGTSVSSSRGFGYVNSIVDNGFNCSLGDFNDYEWNDSYVTKVKIVAIE